MMFQDMAWKPLVSVEWLEDAQEELKDNLFDSFKEFGHSPAKLNKVHEKNNPPPNCFISLFLAQLTVNDFF